MPEKNGRLPSRDDLTEQDFALDSPYWRAAKVYFENVDGVRQAYAIATVSRDNTLSVVLHREGAVSVAPASEKRGDASVKSLRAWLDAFAGLAEIAVKHFDPSWLSRSGMGPLSKSK